MRASISARLRCALLSAAAPLIIASCGGGGGGARPAPQGVAQPKGTLAIEIKVPRRTTTSSRRHAAYISASTESMLLSFNQGQTTTLSEAVGLTPSTNANCQTVSGYYQCTMLVTLAPGSYTAKVSTYDGPVVSSTPTGNLLSQGQNIAVTVTANVENTIPITLDGVPASIVVAPASGSTITGTQTSGFGVQYTAQPLTVEAEDADGNIILGAGAPTFSAAATATKYTVTQPQNGAPNSITLAAAGGGNGTLTVTATPPNGGFSCSDPGVVCTASVALSTPAHTLFVANHANLTVYTSTDDVNWTLADTSPNTNFGIITQITEGSDGTVFLCDLFHKTVWSFASPYTGAAGVITASLNLPGGVAVTASSSQLLVSDRGELDVFASPFTGSPAQTALSGISQSIALDASDDAILGLQNSTVMYAAPNYTSATTINGSVGGAVRVDSSGTLFLADGSGGQVLVYAAPYTGSPTSLTVPSEGGTMIPGTLSEDGSGNLWVEAAPAGGCSSCNYYLFEYTTPFAANQTPALAVNLGSYGYVGPAATQSGYGIDLTGSNTLSVINSSGSTIGTITNGITSPWTMLYVR